MNISNLCLQTDQAYELFNFHLGKALSQFKSKIKPVSLC